MPLAEPEMEIFTGTGSAQFSIYAPQYPKASIIQASRIEDGDGSIMMAEMTTDDALATVAEFYRQTLTDKVFTIRESKKGAGISIMGERPSAGLSVIIGLDPVAGGGTRISLSDSSMVFTPSGSE